MSSLVDNDNLPIAEIEQSQEDSKLEHVRNEISESESRRFLESPKSIRSNISPKIFVNNSLRSNSRSAQNINLMRMNNESRPQHNNADRNSLLASLGQSQVSDWRDQEQSYDNIGLDIQSQNPDPVSVSAKSSNSSDNSYNSSFVHAASSYAVSSNKSRDESSAGQHEKKMKSQFYYPEHPQIIEASREEDSKVE